MKTIQIVTLRCDSCHLLSAIASSFQLSFTYSLQNTVMAINVCGSSKNILARCLWDLIQLILNYKMLEFCPKRLHGNEHIFGIMHNLTCDIHVTILNFNAHVCITCAFLRLGLSLRLTSPS